MGQEFNVVRCFSCCVFQSHQVRKDKKFVCKMCGERQSVRKEYGRGSGKDCRVHVQKLNTLRRSMEEGREAELEARLEEGYAAALEGQEEEEEGFPPHTGWQEASEGGHGGSGGSVGGASQVSKWAKYLSSDSEEEEEEGKDLRHTRAPATERRHY
ncbi:MRN complex-interacting protein-like [Portunus trituberculatus]|uniref:MRN complex-interacting protein-like n=1 Tax=Portunus trituberculatus TaxID=210409 RepID=UPI001E1CE0D0|nr:MRN complex-interacting protein-like [Portunus trituberculatus]